MTAMIIDQGHQHGNKYVITKNEGHNDHFNVYQVLTDTNKHITAEWLRQIQPEIKHLPDEQLLLPINQEPSFLFLHDIDIQAMNRFRLHLTTDNNK